MSELAKQFRRTNGAIVSRLKLLELLPTNLVSLPEDASRFYRQWLPSEEERLLQLYREGIHYTEIAKQLDRSDVGTYLRLIELLNQGIEKTHVLGKHHKDGKNVYLRRSHQGPILKHRNTWIKVPANRIASQITLTDAIRILDISQQEIKVDLGIGLDDRHRRK